MIRRWAKLLPYWVVMHYVKKISPFLTQLGNGRMVYMWRIDKGEFVMYDKENYEILRKKERERREAKADKRFRKIMSAITKDRKVNEKLKEYYECELKEEAEE